MECCETCHDTGVVVTDSLWVGTEEWPCPDCVRWSLTDEVPSAHATEDEPCQTTAP